MLAKNSDVTAITVKAIEGQSVFGGDLMVKPMLMGDEMTIMEIHYKAGVGVPLHVHKHESLIYVVKGKVKTIVGDDTHILEQGDVCRHPAGVPHSVVAVDESIMVEIKSPAPNIADFFTT